MNTDKLVEMANQIAQFFEALPDPHEAEVGVADHLRRFWAPSMREGLITHVRAHGRSGLRPLVVSAVNELEKSG